MALAARVKPGVRRLGVVSRQFGMVATAKTTPLSPPRLRVAQFPMNSAKPADWNDYVVEQWTGDDNYGYAIIDDANREFALVDPADVTSCKQVIQEEEARGNRFVAVLSTHWHFDHAGGNEALRAQYPGIRIYGRSSNENALLQEKKKPFPSWSAFPWHVPECISDEIQEDTCLKIGALDVKAMLVHAHTDNHVAFVVTGDPREPPELFCGDALFVGGCGKWVQNGKTTADLAVECMESLRKLSTLAPETRVRCAHEYTLKNLHFCITADPLNEALKTKLRWVIQQRTTLGPCYGFLPTVPSTIGEEMEYNVFMRATSVEELSRLRAEKDAFTGSGKATDPSLLAFINK